jgi:hypothetical protein
MTVLTDSLISRSAMTFAARLFMTLLFMTLPFGCRPSSAPVLHTDLNRLRQSIVVPAGTTAAKWAIVVEESGGLLPAPGTTVLLARLQLDLESVKQLRSQGGWGPPDKLPAALDLVRDADDKGNPVLRCVSPEPARSIMYGTTWMKIEMFVDEERSVVFLVLKKS